MTPSEPEINISNDRFARFKLYEDQTFNEWLHREVVYWKKIHFVLTKHPSPPFADTILAYIDTISKSLENPAAPITQHNFRDRANQFFLPFHDDDPDGALYYIAQKDGLPTALFNFKQLLINKTLNFSRDHINRLQQLDAEHKSNIESMLEKLTNTLVSRQSNLETTLDTQLKDYTQQLLQGVEEAKSNLNNIVTSATRAILSAEPVTYWENKKNHHKWKAFRYGMYIAIAACGFLACLTKIIFSAYKDSTIVQIDKYQITLPSSNFSLALLVVFTTASIWLVRVLVKIMMTNVALEIEALERLTMIKTYIAMENARPDKLSEAEILFFSTLFRPSPNNLTDDSSSPEFLKIIEALTQKKT